MNRSTFSIVAVTVCAAAALGWLLWQNRPSAGFDAMKHFAARLQDEMRGAKSVPCHDRTEIERVLLAAAPPSDALSSADAEAVAELVSTFLMHLSNADPDAYAAWMKSCGWSTKPLDKQNQGIRTGHRYYTGSEMPDDVSAEKVFDIFFRAALARANGIERPKAVSAEPGDVLWMTGIEDNDSNTPSVFDNNIDVRWRGGSGGGTRAHWQPPISLRDTISRQGSARVSYVLVMVRTQGSLWLPVHVMVFHDPTRNQWVIDNAWVQNTDNRVMGFEW